MQNMVFGNSMWQLIAQSDLMTKFVLLILLFMSIASWAIVFYKLILINIKRKQMKEALEELKKVKSFDDVLLMSARLSKTIPGYFLSKNLANLKAIIEKKENPKLNQKQIELFQQSMYQSISDIIYSEESYLPILSTSAAVSPLLGLFGTVWGLVHSFIRISEKRAADITVVAPGIAEALMTTLAGLMVAVPALVMFHVINLQVNKLEHQLNILADRLNFIVQDLFLD